MGHCRVDEQQAGARLDVWLAQQEQDLSRARWQSLIRSGHVLVNGAPVKAHHVLHEGEEISFEVPPPSPVELKPEPIALDILHEDEDLIVVNKPAGLVVHPAPGHEDGTLVNALLYHCRDLAGIGGELRPGIVHRLDQDTSGALVVAKNEHAMKELARQFKQREVEKEYLALVWGHPEPESNRLETLVGRSTHDRKKMSATPERGRPAITRYTTIEALSGISLLRVAIETGRTHQIRVHMAHAGHPVVGDRQYGGARQKLPGITVDRQMLHAHRLVLTHPSSGERAEFVAPMPEDMCTVIHATREEAKDPSPSE